MSKTNLSESTDFHDLHIIREITFPEALLGIKIRIPKGNLNKHEYLFSEDQSRYLVEVNEKNKYEVSKILEKNGIYYEILGKSQKNSLDLDKEFNIKLENLNKINSFWFKNYFKEN